MRKIIRLYIIYTLHLYIICSSANAQHIPTFWPNALGKSLDFRFEPPRVDTTLFDIATGNFELIGNSLTDTKGNYNAMILEHGLIPQPNTSLLLNDTNFNSIKGIQKGVAGSGNGFISFNDTTHYFYTNNVSGQTDTNVYDYYLSLRTPFNFTYFYKLIYNADRLNDIQPIPKYLNTDDPTPTHFIYAGTDTIIWCESAVKFIKRVDAVYAIYPASKYFSEVTRVGKNIESGIVICKLDPSLNIQNISYHPLIINYNWQPGKQLSIINVLAVNKASNQLIIAYTDSTDILTANIERLDIDENMNLANRKFLNQFHSYHCYNRVQNTVLVSNRTFNLVLSPNDTFLYYFHHTLRTNITRYDTLAQLNVFTGELILLPINRVESSTFSGANPNHKAFINLSPNGKIFTNVHTRRGPKDKISIYTIIDQPNRKGVDCRIITGLYEVDTLLFNWNTRRNYKVNFNIPVTRYYVYNEPISVDCNGITFANRSDTQFVSFNYYFSNTDSIQVNWSQPLLLKKYKNIDNYYLRVKGITSKGYWAWYSDSINTADICYVKANYYSNDSIGCQWVAQYFYDSSCIHVQEARPGERMWVWDFGDGKIDTTFNPVVSHIYTSSGRFSVKMKLHFGKCVDSMTKISIINILPAPKPGFILDKVSGCIPFTVNVSDTLTHNIVYKSYRFATSLADSIIPASQNKLSYTYNTPGRYTIVQKLRGVSGCETTDSNNVSVFEKALNIPSTKPVVSVLQTDKIIVLWKRDTNATSHQILRSTNFLNPINLTVVSDTIYYDSIGVSTSDNTYQYSLKPIDRCNQTGIAGDYETSMRLSATSVKNVYSELNWNNNSATNHNLIIKNYNDSTTIALSANSTSYIDFDFYSSNSTQTCYQLTSTLQNFYAKSNEVCLNYIPMVIIPSYYDYFKYGSVLPIRSYYLKDYRIEIFDSRGKKVYSATNTDAWYNTTATSGYYFYTINGTSKNGKAYSQIGKIVIVK